MHGSELPVRGERPKADPGKRLVAAFIDAVLCIAAATVPAVGLLVAVAYALVRDGLEFPFMDRRSIGKKLMKLRPLRLDGRPLDIATSCRRNALLAIGPAGVLLMVIPVVGWIAGFLIAAAGSLIWVVELSRVFTDPQGRRLGDEMAGTAVAEVPD
ncbi:MAG: RDD family protein [Deferrisomatales bacterium]